MKNKSLCKVLVIFFAIQLVGCSNETSSKLKETNLLAQKSSIMEQESNDNIKKIAYNWLDDTSKDSIIDMENAQIEEITYKEDYFVVRKEDSININGKIIYKVTFNTSTDVLGPIAIYLDKSNLEVLGTDIRK